MKLIYWNTNNIQRLDEIRDILTCCKPDILFLSEIDKTLIESDSSLNKTGYLYFPNPGCNRVSIIKKTDIDISLGLQTNYYTFINFPKFKTSVISVHLPSQMFQHLDGLKAFIRGFRDEIDENIGNPIEHKIIVIGDFNVNPFERPMIDFDGFSATNSINSKFRKTHLGKHRAFYYNPTWKLYANNDFPGTKHYPRPSASSYDVLEHHYLDQVVISVKLLSESTGEKIETIRKAKTYNFFSAEENKVLVSDHLPLSYTINI